MLQKTEKITEYLIYLALGIMIISWFAVDSATSDNVSVSATVSSSMISCSTATDTINFLATLDNASIASTSDAVTTMSSSGGISLSVYDIGSSSYGGGLDGPGNGFIESPGSAFNTTTALAQGTEGYGLQAATTSGTLLRINPTYNYASQSSVTVGRIATPTAGTVVASSASAVTSEKVAATLKAAAAITTPGGAYTDTITLSCTAI